MVTLTLDMHCIVNSIVVHHQLNQPNIVGVVDGSRF